MSRKRKTSREIIEAGEAPYDIHGRYAADRGDFHDEVLHATFGNNDDVYLFESLSAGVNSELVQKFDPNADLFGQVFELVRTRRIERVAPKPTVSRNRKATEYITERQFRNAYTAIAFAARGSIIFNAFISFALDEQADEEKFNRSFDGWLASLADWCRRRKIKSRYVYSLENPPEKHLHAHVLLHIPGQDFDEFRLWCWKSLRRIAPLYYRKSGKAVQLLREGRRRDQWQWFQYMMKGLDPYAGRRRGEPRPAPYYFMRKLDIPKRMIGKPQGRITSKRVGISNALSFSEYPNYDLLDDITERSPKEIWEKDLW